MNSESDCRMLVPAKGIIMLYVAEKLGLDGPVGCDISTLDRMRRLRQDELPKYLRGEFGVDFGKLEIYRAMADGFLFDNDKQKFYF